MQNVSDNAKIGKNVEFGVGVIVEDGAIIGDNVILGNYVRVKSNVNLGSGSYVGDDTILGERAIRLKEDLFKNPQPLIIGENALIRSKSLIYEGSTVGANFQSGHRVTIREKSDIGQNVRIGTLSDIQGDCKIGDYVNLHSNVHIGQKSVIKNYVWIFPYVILTNDPTPPSNELVGVTVEEFAIIATGTVVLPGLTVGKDSLVGAQALVRKNVAPESVVIGNPGKEHGSVRAIKNHITGKPVYPWKEHFDRTMPWEGIGYEAWEAKILNEKI